MRILNRPPNIIRTFPQAFDFEGWEDYVLDALHNGSQIAYYGRGIPRDVTPPAWLYLIHRGLLVAKHRIVEMEHYKPAREMTCWTGQRMMTNGCVVCEGMLQYPDIPIPKRGFQGYRYCADLF